MPDNPEGVSPGKKYAVMVDDNFHYMDGDSRTCLGEYNSEAEALAAARQVVDEFLNGNYAPGIPAEKLLETYRAFGLDPWIPGCSFSAWEYARERCRQICG